MSESLRSLTKNERLAQVAQRKWRIVSESLRSLTKNEWISESLIFLANRSFANFWTKNKRFARKSNERIPSPDYLFMVSRVTHKTRLPTHAKKQIFLIVNFITYHYGTNLPVARRYSF